MSENQKQFEQTGSVQVVDKRTPHPEDPAPPPATLVKSMDDVVAFVISKDPSIEQLEKILAIQDRYLDREAEKAWHQAMALFRAEVPPLPKDKYNRHFESYYTSVGMLLQTVNPVLGKHGLNLYHKEPVQTENTLKMTCVVSHIQGHEKSVTVAGPIDAAAVGRESGKRSRNPLQDLKSTITYLRSATAELILGVSGTVDDDGNLAGQPSGSEFLNPDQKKEINELIKKACPDDKKQADFVLKFLEHMKADTVDTIPKSQFNKAKIALNRKIKEAGKK